MSSSNFLQVPPSAVPTGGPGSGSGSGSASSSSSGSNMGLGPNNPDSVNQTHPIDNTASPHPHTPRGHRATKSTTPTFSFGLSFSPSFHFNNSPIHSASPHKFFHSWKRKQEMFPALSTPPNSTRAGSNRFLDSLKKDDDDLWSSLGDSNLTSLSSIYEEGKEFLTPKRLQRNRANPTEHASDESHNQILENDVSNQQNDSETPENSNSNSNSKSSGNSERSEQQPQVKQENNAVATEDLPKAALESAPTLIPIKPKEDQDSTSKLDLTISRSIKRRKLSSASILDSPNNSIASQIDSTIDSPIQNRKLPKNGNSLPTASTNTSSPRPGHPHPTAAAVADLGDKVWYPELDEILIKCFLKYRDFRNNHTGYSTSTLKNTSQNKVLSRMVFNKTGILRTSKQISSRLFRLAKSKKLDKSTKSQKSNPSASHTNSSINDTLNDLDELIKTPFEHLISNTSGSFTSGNGTGNNGLDSIKTNEIIDHELDLLLSSPKENSLLNFAFKLYPKEFEISFAPNSAGGIGHTFTKLGNVYETSLTNANFLKRTSMVSNSIISKLRAGNIPIWLVKHDFHMDIYSNNDIITSSPISPFVNQINQSHPEGLFTHRALDMLKGSLQSFMKLDARIVNKFDEQEPPSMLNWKCLTKIYGSDDRSSLLVEHLDIINGYYSFTEDFFELNAPFMKNFFKGYINYLTNGNSQDSKKITITQVIYNNPEDYDSENISFNEEKSKIYAFFVHELNFGESGTGESNFDIVRIVNSTEEEYSKLTTSKQSIDEKTQEDDNETVVADSSPYKISPQQIGSAESQISPISHNSSQLRIDIGKANSGDFASLQGPMTAPVYNSEMIHSFNQSMLKQEIVRSKMEELKQSQFSEMPGDIISSTPQLSKMVQPALSHSQSTGNINSFRHQNFNGTPTYSSPSSASPAMRNNSAPGSQPQVFHQTSTTPLREEVNANMPLNFAQSAQFIPPAQQQLMVNLGNGFVPFNTLHPKLQEQFMSVQRQFEIQRQEQQKMFQPFVSPQNDIQNNIPQNVPQNVPQNFGEQVYLNNVTNVPVGPNYVPNRTFSMPSISTAAPSVQVTTAPPIFKENKEVLRAKEIKFGPILEYDPSKDSRKIQQKVSKQSAGTHRFPINTPVTMYKPKKK